MWEVRYCKGFKIQIQHSLWFPKRHKNCLSGNCFSLRCKYLVKQFPACCFILKNGNSWTKKQLISSKKSKLKSFFSWSGNSWFPRYLTTKNNHRPLTRLTTIGSISDQISEQSWRKLLPPTWYFTNIPSNRLNAKKPPKWAVSWFRFLVDH